MIVVDASLFTAWLLNESRHGPEDAVWDILSAETVFVPDHWPNEIANALRRAVRTMRLDIDELPLIAERIKTFDIDFSGPVRVDEIGALAKEALDHGLSANDMIYIRIARQHRLPLATIDQAMRRAAQRMNLTLLPA